MSLEEKIELAKTLRERIMLLHIQNSSNTNKYEMQRLLSEISSFINFNNTLPKENRLEIPTKLVNIMKFNNV